jgi:microcystin-dependent protein
MGDSLMTTIILFAGNFAPRGFAFCEGQLIDIAANTAVFSLLGTMYGGNGTSNFALPDLREAEKSLGGARYIIAMEGIFPSRG